MKEDRRKIAAALKYNPSEDDAPKVVAGGYGEIASRIIEKAEELNIPIYKDPDAARVLVGLEIGSEIPVDLYETVAAILAFVLRLDREASK